MVDRMKPSDDEVLGGAIRALVESGQNVSLAGPKTAGPNGEIIPTGYAVAVWRAGPNNSVVMTHEAFCFPTLDEAAVRAVVALAAPAAGEAT